MSKEDKILSKQALKKLKEVRHLSKQKNKEVEIALMIELDSFLDNFKEVYCLAEVR